MFQVSESHVHKDLIILISIWNEMEGKLYAQHSVLVQRPSGSFPHSKDMLMHSNEVAVPWCIIFVNGYTKGFF